MDPVVEFVAGNGGDEVDDVSNGDDAIGNGGYVGDNARNEGNGADNAAAAAPSPAHAAAAPETEDERKLRLRRAAILRSAIEKYNSKK
jgi:hypothetical protein